MDKKTLKTLYEKDPVSLCWHWQGPAKVRYAVVENEPSKVYYPHILLWVLTDQPPISKGEALARTCSTELCVAPLHHTRVPKQSPIAQYEYTAPARSQPF